MDDLLENTTVIPLVQFLAHICRVFVSMVGLPRVLRPSTTTTTMQYLGLESTSSRECEIFSFVRSLAAIPRSASSSSSSSDDNNNKTAISASSNQK